MPVILATGFFFDETKLARCQGDCNPFLPEVEVSIVAYLAEAAPSEAQVIHSSGTAQLLGRLQGGPKPRTSFRRADLQKPQPFIPTVPLGYRKGYTSGRRPDV